MSRFESVKEFFMPYENAIAADRVEASKRSLELERGHRFYSRKRLLGTHELSMSIHEYFDSSFLSVLAKS
jgi:hypothetical protein